MASNTKHKYTVEICGDLDIVSQSRRVPGLLLKTNAYIYIYIHTYIHTK